MFRQWHIRELLSLEDSVLSLYSHRNDPMTDQKRCRHRLNEMGDPLENGN